MSIRPLAFALLAAILLVFPAKAESCYAPEEARAEKLLRFHTELMVIALTCQRSSDGQDLVKAYTGFTKANISDLHQAEETIKAHYGKKEGTAWLDKIRTRLANEYGQQAARETPPSYCGLRQDKALALYGVEPNALGGLVEKLYSQSRTTRPACGETVKVAAKTKKTP